jgi:hypothetical protein
VPPSLACLCVQTVCVRKETSQHRPDSTSLGALRLACFRAGRAAERLLWHVHCVCMCVQRAVVGG